MNNKKIMCPDCGVNEILKGFKQCKDCFNKMYHKLNDPINRAAVLEINGLYDEAILLYNEVLLIKSNDANAYAGRGVSYYRLRKYDQSWADVHKAQSLGYMFDQEFIENLKKDSSK